MFSSLLKSRRAPRTPPPPETRQVEENGRSIPLTIRRNAQLEARQYQVQGMNYQADSQLQLLGGQNALTSSYFDAGSSLLGGASKSAKLYSEG